MTPIIVTCNYKEEEVNVEENRGGGVMKRCPFCGGIVKYQSTTSPREVIATFICVKCDLSVTIFRKTCEEALDAWNKRPIEDELIEALEEVEEKVLSQYELRDVDLAVWRMVEEALEKARGKL